MPLGHPAHVVIVDLEFIGVVLVGGDDYWRTLVAKRLMVLVLGLSKQGRFLVLRDRCRGRGWLVRAKHWLHDLGSSRQRSRMRPRLLRALLLIS